MPRNYFTDDQIKILSESEWVEKVSRANVFFTKAFKEDVVDKLHSNTLLHVLPSYGIDPTILGSQRLENMKRRILKMASRPERFDRIKKARRSRKKVFDSDEEKIKYLSEELEEMKMTYHDLMNKLTQSHDYKYDWCCRDRSFMIIRIFTKKRKNKLSISKMCRLLHFSRSSYYHYVWKQKHNIKSSKDIQDEKDRIVIQTIFDIEGIEKGAKQIKMQLNDIYGINMNLKRIRRIMRKYGIICTIRQPNPMKAAMRRFLTKNIKDNKVKRNFRQGKAKKVLLTDITYLKYAKGKKMAYLCTIKDASTGQILSWNISESLELDIVINTVRFLLEEHGDELAVGVMLHSDQGCHFTAYDYQNLLEMHDIIQSMSRRGNCWDNAPQESFFSTFKCECDYRKSRTYSELIECTGNYIGYYNFRRPQWGLNRMTPYAYDEYLSGAYGVKLQLPMCCSLPDVIPMGMALSK